MIQNSEEYVVCRDYVAELEAERQRLITNRLLPANVKAFALSKIGEIIKKVETEMKTHLYLNQEK